MSTSVLIVTYGHAEEISDCLDGVAAQGDLISEVIVVDNASPDDTAAVARKHRLGPLVEELQENTGFAGGMNRAAKRASGDYLLLLNPDCVMEAGCLDALRHHLDSHLDVGAAAALLRNLDGSTQLFARRELTLVDTALAMTFVGRILDDKYRNGKSQRRRRYEDDASAWAAAKAIEVDCPAAACVLIRRADAPVPLMDQALPLFFNDNDLYRRLRAKGLRVEIVPAAPARHGYGTSLRRAEPARIRAEMVRSMLDYQRRAWSSLKLAALRVVLVADVLTALVYGRLKHSREAIAHAKGTAGGLGLPMGEPLLFPRHSGRRALRSANSSRS